MGLKFRDSARKNCNHEEVPFGIGGDSCHFCHRILGCPKKCMLLLHNTTMGKEIILGSVGICGSCHFCHKVLGFPTISTTPILYDTTMTTERQKKLLTFFKPLMRNKCLFCNRSTKHVWLLNKLWLFSINLKNVIQLNPQWDGNGCDPWNF